MVNKNCIDNKIVYNKSEMSSAEEKKKDEEFTNIM